MKSKETKMSISLFSPVVTLGCWLSSPSFTSPSRRTSGSDFPWTARKEAALYLKKFAEMMQIDGPRSSRTVDQMRAWAHDSVKGEGREMDSGLLGRKGRKALENSTVEEGKDLRGSDQVLHRQGQSPCKESSQACHPSPAAAGQALTLLSPSFTTLLNPFLLPSVCPRAILSKPSWPQCGAGLIVSFLGDLQPPALWAMVLSALEASFWNTRQIIFPTPTPIKFILSGQKTWIEISPKMYRCQLAYEKTSPLQLLGKLKSKPQWATSLLH